MAASLSLSLSTLSPFSPFFHHRQRIQKEVAAAVEGAISASGATGAASPLSQTGQRGGLGLGGPGSLAAAASAAGDPSARLAHVGRLQAEYAAARAELDEVTEKMKRDITAFETARGGEPFIYQGRRVADTLGQESYSGGGVSRLADPVA